MCAKMFACVPTGLFAICTGGCWRRALSFAAPLRSESVPHIYSNISLNALGLTGAGRKPPCKACPCLPPELSFGTRRSLLLPGILSNMAAHRVAALALALALACAWSGGAAGQTDGCSAVLSQGQVLQRCLRLCCVSKHGPRPIVGSWAAGQQ